MRSSTIKMVPLLGVASGPDALPLDWLGLSGFLSGGSSGCLPPRATRVKQASSAWPWRRVGASRKLVPLGESFQDYGRAPLVGNHSSLPQGAREKKRGPAMKSSKQKQLGLRAGDSTFTCQGYGSQTSSHAHRAVKQAGYKHGRIALSYRAPIVGRDVQRVHRD